MSRQKNIIEVVTIQIKNGVSETHFLKLSHAFAEMLKSEIEGFVKYSLTKCCGQDKRVELVWWESMEKAHAALETATQTIEFREYNAEDTLICMSPKATDGSNDVKRIYD